MRAALPREITSNDPLDPLSINRRPTVEQIGQQWARAQPVGRQKERAPPENGEALERGRKAPPPQSEKEKGPWERGMSVPQRQAGGEKLWDDLDAETFGDHDGSAALSNWAEQAKAFEAEMQAMRKAGGGKLPGEPVGNCVEINQCVGCTDNSSL